MYVEHWIPAQVRHPYPVVLIHGGFGQGSDWFSTPDGRRGWATLFLEQGYKVYVLDRPGQGRNPYQPFVHGAFNAQAPTFEAVGTGDEPADIRPTSRPGRRADGPADAQQRPDPDRLAHARCDVAGRHRPVDLSDRWRRRGVCAGNCRRASGAGQRSRHSRPARGHCLQGVHYHCEQPGTRIAACGFSVARSHISGRACCGRARPSSQPRIDRAETRRSGRLLDRRPAQANALRDNRSGADVRAIHDPGEEDSMRCPW